MWSEKINVRVKENRRLKDALDLIFTNKAKGETLEDRRFEIHISDLVKECPRESWISKKYPEDIEFQRKSLLKMWGGKKLHEIELSKEHEVEMRYRFAKEPYGVIVGTVDEIINDIVIDKKFYAKLPKAPYKQHIKQVSYYMALLWKFGKKVRMGAIYYINRSSFATRVFTFSISEEDIEKAFEEMVERATYLRQAIIHNWAPPKINNEIECSKCAFKDICKSIGTRKNLANINKEKDEYEIGI